MISLIIPLYNEEENVKIYPTELFPVIEQIGSDFNEQFEYIFVDDGSKDRTLVYLKEISLGRHDIRIHSHGINKGLGAAIKTGIQSAGGDLILCIDADLTFRPENIRNLLSGYHDTHADCISGSPYIHEDHMESVAAHRAVISKSINGIYRLLLGTQITAISPIFRLYTKSAIESISISSNNFEINAEILAKLLMSGKRVHEVPVPLYQRRFGVSKINIKKEILNNIRLIYKIINVKYFHAPWR